MKSEDVIYNDLLARLTCVLIVLRCHRRRNERDTPQHREVRVRRDLVGAHL
jgi:hypothetical protein